MLQATNAEVMSLYGECSIPGVIRAQRLLFLRHIVRLTDIRTVKVELIGGIQKKRIRGRPNER